MTIPKIVTAGTNYLHKACPLIGERDWRAEFNGALKGRPVRDVASALAAAWLQAAGVRVLPNPADQAAYIKKLKVGIAGKVDSSVLIPLATSFREVVPLGVGDPAKLFAAAQSEQLDIVFDTLMKGTSPGGLAREAVAHVKSWIEGKKEGLPNVPLIVRTPLDPMSPECVKPIPVTQITDDPGVIDEIDSFFVQNPTRALYGPVGNVWISQQLPTQVGPNVYLPPFARHVSDLIWAHAVRSVVAISLDKNGAKPLQMSNPRQFVTAGLDHRCMINKGHDPVFERLLSVFREQVRAQKPAGWELVEETHRLNEAVSLAVLGVGLNRSGTFDNLLTGKLPDKTSFDKPVRGVKKLVPDQKPLPKQSDAVSNTARDPRVKNTRQTIKYPDESRDFVWNPSHDY